MKNECKDCKHSLYVHPYSKLDGEFKMKCTKSKINIIVFEKSSYDCFENFTGWTYRE